MNDKELADKVVALGVGSADITVAFLGKYHAPDTYASPISADNFVRDCRVAGALMEKVDSVYVEALLSPGNAPDKWQVQASMDAMPTEWVVNESLPRAIIEACCEALYD